MSIGNNIKKYRTEKGLSQEKLANALNISSRTLQNYEADRTVPPLEILFKISYFLDVDIAKIDENNEKVIDDVRVLLDIKKKFDSDMAQSKKDIAEKSKVYVPLIDYVNRKHCDNKYDLDKLLLGDDIGRSLYDDISSLVNDIIANRLAHYNNILKNKHS